LLFRVKITAIVENLADNCLKTALKAS